MKLISKAELARVAGVSRTATTKASATGGPLADAVEGKKINIDHPTAIEWLAAKNVNAADVVAPVKKTTTPRKVRVAKKKTAVKKKAKPRAIEKEKKPATPTEPKQAPITVGGYEIDGLEDLTLREIVMRYGSIDGFKRYVDSLKSISDFNMRDMKMKTHRGELVSRDMVSNTLFPLVDVAYQRLVSDVPAATIQQIIARVESGGDDVVIDCEKIMRDAVSRVLKNTKNSIMKTGILNDGS